MRRTGVVTLAALGGAAAVALVLRRRRSAAPARPAVQIGLADGRVRRLGADDAQAADLRARAADLRAALERGA